MKVLLCGYYGHGNFGDDLLLRIVADRLQRIQELESLTILCDSGGWEYISKWYPDVTTVAPNNVGLLSFLKYDFVVFGGGGTIFDYRKGLPFSYAVKRYLRDFISFRVTRILGTRFIWLGLGVGPFGDKRAKVLSMQRLMAADTIFVRDQESLEQIGTKYCGNVASCPDLSMAQFDEMQALKLQISPDKKHVLIIVRHFKYGDNNNEYVRSLMGLAERMREYGLTVTWAAYQREYDQPVVDQLIESGESVWVWDPLNMLLSEASRQICQAGLVVTARMHGIYLAGMLGVPVVGVALHQKLNFAASIFGRMSSSVSPNIGVDELMSVCLSLLNLSDQSRTEEYACERARVIDVLNAMENSITSRR